MSYHTYEVVRYREKGVDVYEVRHLVHGLQSTWILKSDAEEERDRLNEAVQESTRN